MDRVKCAMFLVAFMLSAVASVMPIGKCFSADNYITATEAYAEEARNRFYNNISDTFASVMSDDEKAIFDSIDFRFPPGGGAFDAFAFVDHGEKVILVAGGFVLFQTAMADAAIIASRFQRSDQMTAYVSEAFEEGVQNAERLKVQKEPVPVMSPERFFGIDIGNYRETDDYKHRMAFLQTEGLAMVLAHEIGHHVNVKRINETQIERENKADRYAMDLCARAGFSPIAAVPLMMGFFEGGADVDHPPAQCRFVNIMIGALMEVETDVEFARYISRSRDASATLSRWRQVLDANRRDIEQDCDRWLFR